MQPQRGVCWLHRLPHHPHQIVAQGVQVSLVAQLCRGVFECLSSVVLPAVEAAIDKRPDASPQRVEQRSDH